MESMWQESESDGSWMRITISFGHSYVVNAGKKPGKDGPISTLR